MKMDKIAKIIRNNSQGIKLFSNLGTIASIVSAFQSLVGAFSLITFAILLRLANTWAKKFDTEDDGVKIPVKQELEVADMLNKLASNQLEQSLFYNRIAREFALAIFGISIGIFISLVTLSVETESRIYQIQLSILAILGLLSFWFGGNRLGSILDLLSDNQKKLKE